jgi:formamidopyrimidine-DNA glycosylase
MKQREQRPIHKPAKPMCPECGKPVARTVDNKPCRYCKECQRKSLQRALGDVDLL